MASVVTIVLSGLAAVPQFIADPAPHHFAHLDTPDLWTSAPVVVDPAKETYQRIAGLPVVADVPATDGDVQVAARAPDRENAPDAGGDQEKTVALQPAVQRIAGTDANKAFHAESREPAASIAATSPGSQSVEQQQSADAGASAPDAHEQWCHERYRSYRPEDNSYQPFDGGPRKACTSPYG
ncbi:BA14K family protein [Neorhizobium sp. NCHU2750]|uniref:BA14K family protein n=1 Tax=Neorhizobium sp. NCHU2750 TaxID=1825976 RepID=UPI0013C4DB8A